MPLVCDNAERASRMRFNYYHMWMDEPEGKIRCECTKTKGLWNINKPLNIPGKLVHRSYGGVDVAIIENDKGFYIISDRHGYPTALHLRRGSLRMAEREMYPEVFKARDKRAATPPPPRKVKAKAPPKPPPGKPRRKPAPPAPRRR